MMQQLDQGTVDQLLDNLSFVQSSATQILEGLPAATALPGLFASYGDIVRTRQTDPARAAGMVRDVMVPTQALVDDASVGMKPLVAGVLKAAMEVVNANQPFREQTLVKMLSQSTRSQPSTRSSM